MVRGVWKEMGLDIPEADVAEEEAQEDDNEEKEDNEEEEGGGKRPRTASNSHVRFGDEGVKHTRFEGADDMVEDTS